MRVGKDGLPLVSSLSAFGSDNVSQQEVRVLSELAKRTAVLFYRMSLPDGTYEYASPGAAALTGYSAEEFCAQPLLIRDLIHPDSREYFAERWRGLLSGETLPLYEYAIRDRGGRTRWLRQQNVFLRNTEGIVNAIEGIVYEITPYKSAESALEQLIGERALDIERLHERLNAEVNAHRAALTQLRNKDTQLRVLTDHLPAAIAYVDKDECYRFNNRTYEEWFGHAPDQIYGKTLRDVLGAAAYAVIEEHVRSALSGTARSFEASIPYAVGGTRHVRAHYVPYRDESGDVQGFYALVSDLTDIKRAEAAEQRHVQELAHAARLASLGEMAAELSHELTQPMSAIAGYSRSCEMWLENGDIERARSAARKLSEQSDLAADIIRSLRRFMQKGAPERRRIDPLDPVRDAMKMARWDADARRVSLELQATEPMKQVQADRTLIEQVVLNLLRNAIDAVNGKAAMGRPITVSVIGSPDSIEVAVTDYGPGLTAEVKERLFEPFFTTKAQGVGIGLVICRRIVEAHGGRLWADNNPNGEGATFRFRLPAAPAD